MPKAPRDGMLPSHLNSAGAKASHQPHRAPAAIRADSTIRCSSIPATPILHRRAHCAPNYPRIRLIINRIPCSSPSSRSTGIAGIASGPAAATTGRSGRRATTATATTSLAGAAAATAHDDDGAGESSASSGRLLWYVMLPPFLIPAQIQILRRCRRLKQLRCRWPKLRRRRKLRHKLRLRGAWTRTCVRLAAQSDPLID